MTKQINYMQKYTLADIFDKTIKMINNTWKDSLLLSAIGFIPYAIAMGAGIYFYIEAIANIIANQDVLRQTAGQFPWQTLAPLFMALGFLLLASLIYSLTASVISGHIALKTYKKAQGKEAPLKETLFFILKNKTGKLILFNLLLIAIFIGLYISLIFGMVIFAIISIAIMQSQSLFIAFVVLLCLAFVGVFIWLALALSFGAEAIVIDDTSVTQALQKSFTLVRGNWWRVFGYTLLLGIVVSFGISLATSPVLIAFLLPVYMKLFESLLQKEAPSLDLPSIIQIMKSLYIPIALISLLQAVGYMLILPVFKTLFYIDLKFRKGEFKEEAGPTEGAGAGE